MLPIFKTGSFAFQLQAVEVIMDQNVVVSLRFFRGVSGFWPWDPVFWLWVAQWDAGDFLFFFSDYEICCSSMLPISKMGSFAFQLQAVEILCTKTRG